MSLLIYSRDNSSLQRSYTNSKTSHCYQTSCLFSYTAETYTAASTYYTALHKQTYSYNELLFIAAETISLMVQAEQKSEHKVPSSSIKNTPDKLSSVLNNRTLRHITNLLDPYKRTPSETPIITLTHILHCYDRTHKLLQPLDLDSHRITQSSQAIQSALESITTLFISTNLH